MELKYLVQGIRTMPGFWAREYLEETIGRMTEEELLLFDEADRTLERAICQTKSAEATVSLLKLVACKAPNDRAQERIDRAAERLEVLQANVEALRQQRFEVIAGIVNAHVDAQENGMEEKKEPAR